MNKHVDLFNKVNKLLEYDKDPIGTTAWWSEPNVWFGWWEGEHLSPLVVLVAYVPKFMTNEEFIGCVEDNMDDDGRGMD